MKRFTALVIMMAMLVGLLPAHAAGDRWETVRLQCEKLGLQVTWYPEYEGLMRRYGTDRMLLVEGGKSYLCALNDSAKLAGPFDAFGEFNGAGLAPACQNGKWGMVDRNGITRVDFVYDGQYAAELAGENYPEFRGKDGEDAPPYALFAKDGRQLTEYLYQNHDRFINGYAMVTDGGTLFDGGYEGWGFIDANGYAVCEQKYRHEALNWPKYSTTTATEYGVFDQDGFAIVCTNEGFNVIDNQGRELLDTPSPKRPWRAGDGTWGFVDAASGKVGFMDGQGQIVEEPQYDDPSTDPKGFQQIIYRTRGAEAEWLPHEGLLRFQTETDGLWGFWDETGEKTVVPALFDAAGYFDHGCASVMVDGVFGLLYNPLLEDEDAHKVSDWAVAEVNAATEAGYVTEGCKAYQTYTITREQFASLAVNYLEKKTGQAITPAPADTFTDTVDEDVLKAYAAGIVQGMGDGLFGPGGPLSREQLATMLWRAMNKAGVTAESADLSAYTDNDQVSNWAKDSVAALAGLKVMEGTGGGLLSPKASCTVEQAILLVWRAAEKK